MHKLLAKVKDRFRNSKRIRPLFNTIKYRIFGIGLWQALTFHYHEILVEKRFAAVKGNYSEASLPIELNHLLLEYLNKSAYLNSKQVAVEYSKKGCIDNLLHTDLPQFLIESQSKAIYKAWVLDPKNSIVKAIHDYIRKVFADYFSSPICFLNSRAWITQPESIYIGKGFTNSHRDGFEDGHLKIMIYPEGLTGDNGGLEILGEDLGKKSPGTLIAFKNSDLTHRAIAGKLGTRLACEITVMRTFIPIEQLNPSSFNGRHYPNAILPYYLMTRNNKDQVYLEGL